MINYRRANISDIEALVDIRLQFLRYDKPDWAAETDPEIATGIRQYYTEAIPTGECIHWLAESDNRIIGSGALSIRRFAPGLLLRNGKSAYIFNIYIVPDFRKQGIATEIIRRLIADAKQHGVTRLELHATEMGYPVYTKLGFRQPNQKYLEFFVSPDNTNSLNEAKITNSYEI
ncbi:MAG: GNAT family N-acetyltransferase [Planctomycetaceae bacterium]|jgi:GNAT superfamily N-acetyltransferase|nr:GNAT family N-acetyltransferase [Planctomycetaceae bacterium]